jgi:tRNA-Thr(GGU) m(6)t(6)A37 methyltransferase TsaA
VRSTLTQLDQAPPQTDENAPMARIELADTFREALDGLGAGDTIVVLTWLHLAPRDTLKTHPRGDRARLELGVFATRSPARPNPIGLHVVEIVEVRAGTLHVAALEAIDGTPVLDIKPVLTARGFR